MVHRRFVWVLSMHEQENDKTVEPPTCEMTIIGNKVVWNTGGLGSWCGLVWLSCHINDRHSEYSRFKAACSPSIGVCASVEPLKNKSVDCLLRFCGDNVSNHGIPEIEKLQGQLQKSVHGCVWKYKKRKATGMTVKRDKYDILSLQAIASRARRMLMQLCDAM